MASMSQPADNVLAPDNLLAKLAEHWPDFDQEKVLEGFQMAVEAHSGQTRQSGEPYVNHPIQVAETVADYGLDADTVIAALLHDVLEDTDVTPEDIQSKFGSDVLHMIEGVTKLKIPVATDSTERQKAKAESTRAAESLRKLLLAMAQDFRVMVIKLADRLHNMKTLDAFTEAKQARIARETLDIYAPIASRLGIWQLKWQLEDLAFKILHPDDYSTMKDRVAKSRSKREQELSASIEVLQDLLKEKGLGHVTVMGRPKHLYSIYVKHVKQKVPFDEIYDLIALRIITEQTYECYLALGLVYEIWKPIPGLYSDYIQNPKSNGYQSLHTKVEGPGGDPLEIQIRTKKMHEIAEFGVAAHWSYKEQGDDALPNPDNQFARLRKQLFDWSKDNSMSSDFLRSVSSDLFSEQVFAFTPKGDVIDLPAGSTIIDFAFRVHSRIGERLVGATINGKIVPLSTKIENGDIVHLQTRANAEPSLDWLRLATSSHTRSKLRAYLRKRNRAESISHGKAAIEREVRNLGLDPREVLSAAVMKEVAQNTRDCVKAEDVYARVGEGIISVASVVNRLRDIFREQKPDEEKLAPVEPQESTVVSGGIDNVMIKRARCCQPVPGEDVQGYVTRGRGIVIHRRLCPNLQRLVHTDGERIMPIDWRSDSTTYPVGLKIVMIDRQGLLMDITVIIAEAKANVVGAKIKTLPNHTAEIDISIEVSDINHLKELMTKIGNYSDVLSVLRGVGSGSRK